MTISLGYGLLFAQPMDLLDCLDYPVNAGRPPTFGWWPQGVRDSLIAQHYLQGSPNRGSQGLEMVAALQGIDYLPLAKLPG